MADNTFYSHVKNDGAGTFESHGARLSYAVPLTLRPCAKLGINILCELGFCQSQSCPPMTCIN